MGQVLLPPRVGTNKITLEGYDHLTWRSKIIPYIRTDNCIDMSNMFSGENYQLPETLDLRRFNTSKVTDMRAMFDHCMSTSILGLENFDTSKVTDMSFMFNEAHITTLDTSNLDTSKVTTMENMFCNCPAEVLDVSGFNTELVTNMSCLFEGVPAELDVSNFDTSSVTTMHNMFKDTGGQTLDLTSFNTSLVTDMSSMFDGAQCEELDVSNFDMSSVEDMARMFAKISVDELDISNLDLSNVEVMSNMFYNSTIGNLIFPQEMNLTNVKTISGMFNGATIPTLVLHRWDMPALENRQYLFSGFHADTLDLSDLDLGEHAGGINESLFSNANIDNLIFSNSNNFPEGYDTHNYFGSFKTSGTLDLSSFNFNKATLSYKYYPMFYNAKINTLILPDVTNETFAGDTTITLFQNTGVELLDMSNAIYSKNDNYLFNGLIATRINMPNFIPLDTPAYTNLVAKGKAKYVDYSAVNTIGANYNNAQWGCLSNFAPAYVKIMWIPSTFVLDGNHNMLLGKEIYTDAANYSELGWALEPTDAIIHYNSTHEDFEQAILDDDIGWKSPLGNPIFFCHTHVPLGTVMTQYQFESDYSTVNIDGEDVSTNEYVFDEVGEHILTITANNYDYKQIVQVDDHGDYTTISNPNFYKYQGSYDRPTYTYSYIRTQSDAIQFRLYNDKYLFVYPTQRITSTETGYYRLESAPSTSITKVSGVPHQIGMFMLKGCTQLTDISELIICTTGRAGFNPNQMFYNCTNLTDVSAVDKWNWSRGYYIHDTGRVGGNMRSGYWDANAMFAYTGITSAPKMQIPSGSSGVFMGCTNLTDISKITGFQTVQTSYSTEYNGRYNNLFYGCNRLSNVDRLNVLFKAIISAGQTGGFDLYNFLYGTAIANLDFFPENFPIKSMDGAFAQCSSLTDISGIGRIKWRKPNDTQTGNSFYQVFMNIPATDYSALSNWDCCFSQIYMGSCKMSNLSFMQNWDLSKCNYYNFNSCPNLISVSALKNKITTDKTIRMYLSYTPITSCDGLQGATYSDLTFVGCASLQSTNGLQGATINNLDQLFDDCTSLTDITALADVTFSDTNNPTNMFRGCTSLTSLNGLQNMDVSNFTSLAYMFYQCTSLSDISAIAGWNPYQVKNIRYMFCYCRSITSFSALSDWITGQLTDAYQAFSYCSSLQNLNGLNGINIGQCTRLDYLFHSCTSLTDISGIMLWFVGNCQNMSYMFYDCTNLTSIAPIRYWMVSKLNNMSCMFYNCKNLTDVELLNDWSDYRAMNSVNKNSAFYNVPKPWPTWA